MSDPSSGEDTYICHGPMLAVELPHVYDGTCAFVCPECGKWRHRFLRGDPLRALVNLKMPEFLAAEIGKGLAK